MKVKKQRTITGMLLAALLLVPAMTSFAAGTKALIHPNPLYNGQNSGTAVNGYEADGRPSAVDAATWARLNDMTIEYEELENLVKYKSTIGQNREVQARTGLQKSMNELTQAMSDSISDLRDQASQLKEEGQTGAAAILDASVKVVENNKAEIVTNQRIATNTVNSKAYGGQQQILSGVLQMFSGYQSLRELRNMYQKQMELYQSLYELSLRQQQSGLGTAAAASAALYDWNKAKLQFQNNEESLRSLRVKFGTMLGFTEAESEALEIGTLPAYDPAYLASRDLNADIKTAKQHNNAYGKAYRSERSDQDITGYTAADIDYRAAVENIGSGMNNLYQSVVAAAAQYDAAQSSYRLAVKEKDAAERKFAAGISGLPEYKRAEVKAIAAEMSANIAGINASSALSSYQWAVKGVM